MQTMLNVRIDKPLKERGDKVLREHGISTSEAVRALWRELASTRALPDFLKSKDAGKALGKARALKGLVGIAGGKLTDATDEELEELGRQRYA